MKRILLLCLYTVVFSVSGYSLPSDFVKMIMNNQDNELINAIVKQGFKEKVFEKDSSVLVYAVKMKKQKLFKRLFNIGYPDIYIEDEGVALVHKIAIDNNDPKTLLELIKAGYTNTSVTNPSNEFNTFALIPYTFANATEEIIKVFIDNGLNIKTELYYASEGGEPKTYYNLYYYAVAGDNLNSISALQRNGLDINALLKEHWFSGDYYYTPLDYAIKGKNKDVINFVINLGGMTFLDIVKSGNIKKYMNYLDSHCTVLKINDTDVRFRQNPNLNGKIIDKFQKDEMVLELNTLDQNRDWRMVCRMNGDVGFVSMQYTSWVANSKKIINNDFSKYIYD